MMQKKATTFNKMGVQETIFILLEGIQNIVFFGATSQIFCSQREQ